MMFSRQIYRIMDRFLKIPFLFFIFISLTYVSCSDEDPILDPVIPWFEDEDTLGSNYFNALDEVSSPDFSKISTTLMPISADNSALEQTTIDDKQMVLVCTILNQNNLRYWEATEPFRLTKETGIWGTIPAEWSMKANESYTVGETNFREWFAY